MLASELFSWPESLGAFAGDFPLEAAPWEWLPQVKIALRDLAQRLPEVVPPGLHIEGPVHLSEGVKLPPFGALYGPCWIGPGCELRPGVYVRGNVIAGANCVLGNSSEFKNCLLLDGVQVPHFNYVGDSILGNRAHLGAGVILANLRLDQKTVPVATAKGRVESGLRKLGGIFGDDAEAGCNTVINPGTVLGKGAVVMPGNPFSGYLADRQIAHTVQQVRTFARRD
ncbi:MAG: UDP-N-acetylglucosamine diphosphorylase [Opitutales bacterium]